VLALCFVLGRSEVSVIVIKVFMIFFNSSRQIGPINTCIKVKVKVKVKLFLCLTKRHAMKTYWGVEV
jgi:hypothetical protein